MLDKIKLLLGIQDDARNDELTALISQCSEEFKSICHTDSIDEGCVEQMVLYRFSRLGTEGLASESYTGASYSYAADYPTPLYRLIISHRKMRVVQ